MEVKWISVSGLYTTFKAGVLVPQKSQLPVGVAHIESRWNLVYLMVQRYAKILCIVDIPGVKSAKVPLEPTPEPGKDAVPVG